MERIKAEYLQKILEQVNNQNIEYFENLACEYTVQYQMLISKEPSTDQQSSPVPDEEQPCQQLSPIDAIEAKIDADIDINVVEAEPEVNAEENQEQFDAPDPESPL